MSSAQNDWPANPAALLQVENEYYRAKVVSIATIDEMQFLSSDIYNPDNKVYWLVMWEHSKDKNAITAFEFSKFLITDGGRYWLVVAKTAIKRGCPIIDIPPMGIYQFRMVYKMRRPKASLIVVVDHAINFWIRANVRENEKYPQC